MMYNKGLDITVQRFTTHKHEQLSTTSANDHLSSKRKNQWTQTVWYCTGYDDTWHIMQSSSEQTDFYHIPNYHFERICNRHLHWTNVLKTYCASDKSIKLILWCWSSPATRQSNFYPNLSVPSGVPGVGKFILIYSKVLRCSTPLK